MDERREAAEIAARHPHPSGLDQRLLGPVEQGIETGGQNKILEAGHGAFVADLAAQLARLVGRLVEQSTGRSNGEILEHAKHAATEHIVGPAVETLQNECASAEIGINERCG